MLGMVGPVAMEGFGVIWDEHTLLMIDWHLVSEESNTSMVRERARKCTERNPILAPEDRRLSLGAKASALVPMMVVKDGVYRLWYQIRGARRLPKGRPQSKDFLIGYAESNDGYDWKPAHIGQVEFRNSKRNNLVPFARGSEPDIRVAWPLHDPLDSEYPFKVCYYRPGRGTDLETAAQARWPSVREQDWWLIWGIARSRDGIVWEPPAHEHNLVRANPETARLYRALDGAYVTADQGGIQADIGGRNVKGWLSHDGVTSERVPGWIFTIPEHLTRIYRTYACDPAWDGTRWVQPHIGLVVGRKGPTMVALNGYLYCCSAVETYAQTSEVGLSISATGYGFQEVWPLRPFIGCGELGAFDDGMACQCYMLDDGDETRFYYAGGQGNLSSAYRGGVASIPRDRYGYRCIRGFRDVEPRPRSGMFALKPVTLPDGPRIGVNVTQVSRTRTVRLELTDEKGRAIRGYALKDCVPITRAGLRRRIRWRDGRNASELAGRQVSIRAELRSDRCGPVKTDSPRVYAVYLR